MYGNYCIVLQVIHQSPVSHQSPPTKRRRTNRRDEGPPVPFEINTPEVVLPPTRTRRRSKVEERVSTVKSELVAARDDVDQINRAINSILQQEAKQSTQGSTSRTTPRTRQNIKVIKLQNFKTGQNTTLNTNDFDINKLDLSRMEATETKLEPGEVISEEIVQEEVVEEDAKEYYPITVAPDGTVHQQEYVTVTEDGTVVSSESIPSEQLVAVPAEGGYQQAYGDGSVQQLIEMVQEEVVQDGDDVYQQQQVTIESPETEEQYIEVPLSSVMNPAAENSNTVSITAQPQRMPLASVGNNVETLYINGQQVKIIRAQPNLIQQLRLQGMNVQVEHVSDNPVQGQSVEQEYVQLDPSQLVIDNNQIVTTEGEGGELVQECVVQDSYILDDGNMQEVVLEEQVH